MSGILWKIACTATVLATPLLAFQLAETPDERRERANSLRTEAVHLLPGACAAVVKELRNDYPPYLMVEVTDGRGVVRCPTHPPHPQTVDADAGGIPNVHEAMGSGGLVRGEETPFGLTVAVTVDRERALQPADSSMGLFLGLFLGLLGLVGAGGAWAAARIARARRAAAEAAARMASVLESTTDAVAEVGRDWRIAYLNPRAAGLLPIKGDLTGRTVWDVLPEIVGTRDEARLRSAMERQEPGEFETRGPRTGRWFSMRVFPSRNGIAVYFRDITERKAAEAERTRLADALEAERSLLRTIVDNIPAGLLVVEAPSGRLVMCNAMAERITGHAIPEIPAVSGFARLCALHPDGTPYRPEDYPLVRAMTGGTPVEVPDMLYRRGDGRVATLSVGAVPVKDAEGRVRLVVSSFVDVSEHKRIEAELRRSEERLKTALRAANAGVFETDLRAGTETWSEEQRDIYGAADGTEPGSPARWGAALHPADKERMLAHAARVRRGEIDVVEERFRIVHPTRGVRWIQATASVVRDAAGTPVRVSGLNIDVTAGMAMEEALRESERRLSLALESARAGSWEWDTAKDMIRWSEENYRIHGLEPGEKPVRLEDWLATLHPEDRELARRRIGETLEARRADYEFEYRVVVPGGAMRWVSGIGKAYYDTHGRPVRMSGLNVDITDRKALECALRAAKEDADRANQAKSRFLAAASHDLRQPLQSLTLFAGALHSHLRDARGLETLVMLERGLDTLRSLLDSLLDVSRLDANVVSPQVEEFDIVPLVREIAASYAPLADSKGMGFRVNASCDGILVRSDRTLLGRMIRNLVENAVRYTEQGHVVISCRTSGTEVLVEVSDTGVGIPPEQTDMIFEEFHQVSNPERDRGRGLGLGLSIVRRLSLVLGHEVSVRSVLGEGSVFSVRVPRAEADAAAAGKDTEAAGTVQVRPRPGRGRLALLIDDDTIVLLALREIFGEWGYDTLVAGSEEQALERVSEAGCAPEVVVADYRLRGGLTGTRAIRSVREAIGSNVPGIILTGETGTECARDAAEHGLLVVHKPVSPSQLAAVLERLLGDQRDYREEAPAGYRPDPHR